VGDPVFQRPLEVPAQAAVERAVKWLTHHGYNVSAQSEREASLVHPGGLAPQPPRHGIKVASDGKVLTITHLRASIFDAPPSQTELAWFERVVEELVAVAGKGPAAVPKAPVHTPAFCPECGTRAEPGSATCGMCGAKF
jgi:hypothetical protein